MTTATNTARGLFAIAILSCTIPVPAAAATAQTPTRHTAPHAIKTRINPKDGAVMVYVPAGKFLMGSNSKDTGRYWDEAPQHKVYLDAFWIYENDVTVAEYRKFCKVTGRKMPLRPSWGWKDDHPIVNVIWDDAKAYCDWAGASLPTEAEWEKAARGTDGREFPWGNRWDRRKLWCSSRPFSETTAPVGSYPGGASPYGCLDMVGNVLQWCADWYDEDYYARSPTRNPTGPASGYEHVLRGSSWLSLDEEYRFRCARRSYPVADVFDLSCYFGFRCLVRARR